MHSLFYEDITVGQTFRSPGRTVTEADNTFFCMLSGDWNPVHANVEFCKSTRYGQRIVAGIFGVTLITGAMTQWGIFDESAIAMLNLKEWTFKGPILIGDTITVEMEITGKRLTSKGDAGIIQRRFSLLNQSATVIQIGSSDMMIALRPGAQR